MSADLVLRTAASTTLALIAFAANSVLCRLALDDGAIDPASFTTIRIVSGAGMLLVVSGMRPGTVAAASRGDWASGGLMFVYAVPFAFAYVTLAAGTGALILFGCTQATMLVAALRSGERPTALEWTGLAAAAGGLVYLVSPGLTAPDPVGSLLMAMAAVAWGLYSLRGRRGLDPLHATTGNFVRAVPLVLMSSLVLWWQSAITTRGAALAALSGAVTSGLGYVVWYAALRHLTATRAAIVQLPVPLLAALGGVVFLAEAISLRLVVSASLILGGVGLAIASRRS